MYSVNFLGTGPLQPLVVSHLLPFHVSTTVVFTWYIVSDEKKIAFRVFKIFFWFDITHSNIFATVSYAGSVSDPFRLQPALVRSDCYSGWSPGAQLAQHQQNRLASGHDRHDPTPDDPECCQSSGWDLQTAAATQDCVRLNGSSFCHKLGGVRDMLGAKNLLIGQQDSSIAINLSSVCVWAKYSHKDFTECHQICHSLKKT